MIGARFYTQLDALQAQCDKQEDELAKELENGRLYRMLVKLGCINERPEYVRRRATLIQVTILIWFFFFCFFQIKSRCYLVRDWRSIYAQII